MKENEENEVNNEEVKAEETEKVEVKEEVKEEPKKEEAKVDNSFKQATQTETKPSFFKRYGLAIFICLVVVAVAVTAVVLFMNKKNASPETVFNTYVDAMKEGNADKLMDVTDVKGVIAWASCGKNTNTFIEKYNSKYK